MAWKDFIIALKQDPGAAWVRTLEPGTLAVFEAQSAETSGAPESTVEKVTVGTHCSRDSAVFSRAYRNRDYVFWRVHRRADCDF